MSTGNSTGVAAKAIYDSEHRPITAGGFVTSGSIVFKDISKESNLAGWTHAMGTLQKKYILDADGSGVGLIDYDNDGWLDIYMVNGSTFDALDGKATPPHAALFHNMMTEWTASVAPTVASAYDFSATGTLVDVGRGHG